MKKFYIKSFGCIQNTTEADQIRQIYLLKGYKQVDGFRQSDITIINSCVVRESAENRVYGLINEIEKYAKKKNKKIKIVVTGCLVGWINKNRQKNKSVKKNFSGVSFLPLAKIVGDKHNLAVIDGMGLIPISSGCNNFCSYCIVPFARGKEKSRSFEDVIETAQKMRQKKIKHIMLIGQNVNSYGSDLVKDGQKFKLPNGKKVEAVMVKSMGKKRIPSLFSHLLEEVAKLGFEKVSFVSSNPWDFSDELIDVISKYENIDKLIHLPIQAGDNEILAKMNRAYTTQDYEKLVKKIRQKIDGVTISTDIIIGFPGETDEIFEKSFEIYKRIGFKIGYLNKYSPRSGTVAEKLYKDDIDMKKKKQRWNRLNELINKNS